MLGGNYFPSGGFGIFRQAAMVLIDKEGDVQIKTGTYELKDESVVSLFPNPSQGVVQIQSNLRPSSPLKIMVYNAQGQLVVDRVLHEKLSSIQLGRKGIYFYKCLVGKEMNVITQGKLVVE